MKLKAEKFALIFECTNYEECINFLNALDRLATCWCNRHGGTCKDCMLKSIVDDRGVDLCDIFTDLYNSAL
jgi:hypothetical protein